MDINFSFGIDLLAQQGWMQDFVKYFFFKGN